MGRPPWTRVFACSTASSSTRCAPPTISAVRASEPARSAGVRSASPSPTPPSRSSGPTSTPSNVTSKSFSPLIASSGRRATPGRSVGTTTRLGAPPTRTATTSSSARCASLTKSLRPLSRPGTAHASVTASGANEPSSSTSARLTMRSPAARAGSRRLRWAGLPPASTSDVATTALATNGPGRPARPISSTSTMTSSSEPSLPPRSEGIKSPGQPSSPMRRQSASSKPRASRARRCTSSGGQCWRRNERAVVVKICWAGESRKSISARPGRDGRLRLSGKAEAAHGDRGAEDLGGTARDRVPERRLVEVRDLSAELRPPRARAQRPPDAEQVHAQPRQLLPGLVGVDLGDRGLVRERRAVADEAAGAIEDEAERRDVGRDRRKPAAYGGIAREWYPADGGRVGVLHELTQHACERRRFVEVSPEPVGVEPVQERLKAFAGRAEYEISRHAHVVQEHLVMIDFAGHAPNRADVHTLCAVGHHEHAEASAAPRLATRSREHQPVRRDAGVARPDLVAADHPVIAVAPRFGLERQQIGAGVGLAVALPERRLAARDRRQHLAPQALGSELEDRVGGLPHTGERPERGAGERQLLHEHELHEHRLLAPAEALGPAHAEPALRAERLHEGA